MDTFYYVLQSVWNNILVQCLVGSLTVLVRNVSTGKANTRSGSENRNDRGKESYVDKWSGLVIGWVGEHLVTTLAHKYARLNLNTLLFV